MTITEMIRGWIAPQEAETNRMRKQVADAQRKIESALDTDPVSARAIALELLKELRDVQSSR